MSVGNCELGFLSDSTVNTMSDDDMFEGESNSSVSRNGDDDVDTLIEEEKNPNPGSCVPECELRIVRNKG